MSRHAIVYSIYGNHMDGVLLECALVFYGFFVVIPPHSQPSKYSILGTHTSVT